MADSRECAGLYQYDQLRPGEIRLLTLEPGIGDEPLIGTLDVCSLVTIRPFAAVSYAWGSPVVQDRLFLQNGHLPVSRSVQTALRRFRLVDCPTTLWIVQVCINQEDTRERGHQVSVMSRIYSQAEQVLAWLGESEPSDALAFWALHTLASESELMVSDVCLAEYVRRLVKSALLRKVDPTSDISACPCCDIAFANTPESSLDSMRAISALKTLFSRPYWNRLWPVQEIALGDVSIYYAGSHFVDLTSVYRVTEILAQAQIIEPFFSIRFGQLSLMESACRARVSALQTAIETSKFACSEPRDRIFAIRPLTSEVDDSLLLPDYSIPLTELWRRVALCALQSKPHLRCSDAHDSIALALASNRSHSGPSWVPDVASNSDQQWKKVRYYTQYSRDFCAGGRGESAIGHDARCIDSIHIAGFAMSSIEAILHGSELEQAFGPSSDLGLVPNIADRVEKQIVPWYLACRRFIFERTNKLKIEHTRLGLLLRQGDEWAGYETPELSHCRNSIERALDFNRQPLNEPRLDVGKVFADIRTFLSKDSYRRYADARWTLASANDGRVAWIPCTAKVGDVVCLYQGAPLPFIVRKRDDGSYENLGDAFVYGIMRGEAWPASEEGVDTIHLR